MQCAHKQKAPCEDKGVAGDGVVGKSPMYRSKQDCAAPEYGEKTCMRALMSKATWAAPASEKCLRRRSS